MDGNTIIVWLIVGLVAGVLASLVVGWGYGLLADILIGIAGAFVGGWVFREMHWQSPFTGLAGSCFVAFVGAALLLAVLRLLHGGFGRGAASRRL